MTNRQHEQPIGDHTPIVSPKNPVPDKSANIRKKTPKLEETAGQNILMQMMCSAWGAEGGNLRQIEEIEGVGWLPSRSRAAKRT